MLVVSAFANRGKPPLKGKEQPFEFDEEKIKVMEILKGAFGDTDPFDDLKREYELLRARRRC